MKTLMRILRLVLVFIIGGHAVMQGATSDSVPSATSKDACVRTEKGSGDQRVWVLGTARVEKRLSLDQGRFALVSFLNKRAASEYVQNGGSPEFRLPCDSVVLTGLEGGWTFIAQDIRKGKLGELELVLMLERSGLRVTRHYIAYPETGIIREWTLVDNRSANSVTLKNPFFFTTTVLGETAKTGLEFSHFTGAYHLADSQQLVTKKVDTNYAHEFSSPYAAQNHMPLMMLSPVGDGHGLFFGWDYLGPWAAPMGAFAGSQFHCGLRLDRVSRNLAPGESVELPHAFTGVFKGDLDDLGNEMLDWQYAFAWEYKNPAYFAQPRLAVDFPSPWLAEGGTAENWSCRLALDLYFTDLARYAGAGVLWDDAGWYDEWGSWNGPDFGQVTRYLRKHDMTQMVWLPSFMTRPGSQAARDLGNAVALPKGAWGYSTGVDQSRLEATAWQRTLLDQKVRQWGDFQWRLDGAPGWGLEPLAADQQFRLLMDNFLTDHPGCAIDASSLGGASLMGVDLGRYVCSIEVTDGQGVRDHSGYYGSMMLSPDMWHWIILAARGKEARKHYDIRLDRMHLRMNPCWFGDPGTSLPYCKHNTSKDYPANAITGLRAQSLGDLEKLRKDWDLYAYLRQQGVAGQWGHVFRPKVEGDQAVLYFQRMNRAGTRGVIVTTRSWEHPEQGPPGAVCIFPEGLDPKADYDVRYDFDKTVYQTNGAALMSAGILIETLLPGEIIFLNLPHHPGAGTDKKSPDAPRNVRQRVADYVFTQGVEVSWEPASDDNWLSGYQVYRIAPDGGETNLGRVSRGTFFFDRSAIAAKLARCHYEVEAIDGDGNTSSRVRAKVERGEPERHYGFSGFGSTQPYRGWTYEWTLDNQEFKRLTWATDEGYEGRWTTTALNVSGKGFIGRTIMAPDAGMNITRTFVAPHDGTCILTGVIRRDLPPGQTPAADCHVRLCLNAQQVWPATGLAQIPADGKPVEYKVEVTVHKGDRIAHLLERHAQYKSVAIEWNPVIEYR